jgi:OFA family oxalate/formate antiporter-like MFS transporter
MQKYISLISAIVVQMALGGIYAYSIYVPSFNAEWGFSSAQTQTVFGLTVFLFTVFMIYSGKKLIIYGPRKLILVSALLFATGHIIVSASNGNYALFALGYLLFIAPSISFGYVCAVSTGLLWFSNKKGLVTGLAVAGYGAGGVLLSFIVESLFTQGWGIQKVLVFVGLVWGSAIFISGLLSSTPPGLIKRKNSYSASKNIYKYKKEFSALCIYILCGTMPGLMMIGALKPFALFNGVTATVAATGVALLAIGNGLGRISWGALADKIKPKKLVVFNMVGIITSMALLFMTQNLTWLYLPSAFILGYCFGGPLVLAPNQTGLIFGSRNLSQIYPWVLLFHGIAAALGASIAGVIFQITGSYNVVLILASSIGILGLFSYYSLMSLSKKI